MPTLQDVLALAENAAAALVEGEPEATARRIKGEIDAERRFYMTNIERNARDAKGHPSRAYDQGYQKCGLTEMRQRSLIANKTVQNNPGLRLAVEAHYEKSVRHGKLDTGREVAWILDAWIASGSVLQWADLTLGGTNAAAYFKGENITPTLSSDAIFFYKSLVKND